MSFCRLRLALLPLLLLSLALSSGCSREGGEGDEGADAAADSLASTEAEVPAEGQAEGSEVEDGDSEAEEQDEAIPVEVVVLAEGPMEAVLRSTANLEAERAVGVYAEAARRVVELLVEEGDLVRKGQLLLRLQDDEQQSNLAKAQSQLAQAEREATRQRDLHERGLSSDRSLSDALYDLEQKQIAVQDAERELGYARVRAPIAGTVTRRLVNVGDQVSPGQHLFDMVDFESLVARVYVPEKNLKELRAGMPARVYARAVREEPFEGSILRISPVVDARSGTAKVTVAVGGQPGLRPGLYMDVELITAARDDALRVPKRALVYDSEQIFLFRLAPERKVERLRLVPGLSTRDWIEPLEGLAVGDTVISAGQASLKDGSTVRLPGDPRPPREEEAR